MSAGSGPPTLSPRTLRVIGIGPGGLDQVSVEAVAAMRACDWFLVADKSASVRRGGEDPLVALRTRMLARHVGPDARVVSVEDPPRERRAGFVGSDADYGAAVAAWHQARVDRYLHTIEQHPGDVGFLVWGDPAFYDSTLRILDRVVPALAEPADIEVVAGVSAVQLLAARHRIVLHDVGRPLHVTTGRGLQDALAAGQDNVVVMLNRDLSPLAAPALADWSLWWGANLGTPSEELVAGAVGEVRERVHEARERARASAGWVMDVYLLRAPQGVEDPR